MTKNRNVEWIFHVGAHKTATTHVQDTLELVSQELLRAGVYYVPRKNIRQLERLNKNGKTKRSIPIVSSILEYRAARAHWLRKIDTDCRKILISEERIVGNIADLFNTTVYPNIERNLIDLMRIIRNPSVVFYLGIRSFGTILPSNYGQLARKGRAYPGSFDRIKQQTLNHPPSWKTVVDRMANTVGAERLRVWTYEDYSAAHAYFLAELCGRAITRFPDVAVPRSTKSPSRDAILQLERIDANLRNTKAERHAAGARICEADTSSERYQPFSPEEQSFLDDVYQKDIARIEKDYPNILVRRQADTGDAPGPTVH